MMIKISSQPNFTQCSKRRAWKMVSNTVFPLTERVAMPPLPIPPPQHHLRTLASKIISDDSSLIDGMISLVITAPFSITDYFKFLFQVLHDHGLPKKIPATIGYLKSPQITIETEEPLNVVIDGDESTHTPLHCETLPGAVRINVGEGLRGGN